MKSLYLFFLWVPLVFGEIEVTTSQGRLRGQILKDRNGRNYFAFTSIPYAQPPVGNLRFMPPVPAKPWTGLLDATKASPICYQWDYVKSITIGQEDCLYLNVYTKEISNSPLPVLIYIHGGSFQVGDAGPAESSQYFLARKAVLVTLNYRLNKLGFLSLEDEIIPGNMGLKDQALALEWVRKEIKAFGGNPDLITIFGNSAGGASAHYLCSAPRLSGQIKGCISQSGVGGIASSALSRPGEARAAALQVVKVLGCLKNETLSCLQHKSLEEISNRTLPFSERYIPVIEPPSDHAIITSWPSKKKDFPWITGTTADEGLLFTGPIEFNLTNRTFTKDEFRNYFKSQIRDTLHLGNQSSVVERIFNRFTAKEPNLILAARKFSTEAFFLFPTLKALKQHNGPKYFYIFNYIGGPSFYEVLLNKDLNITGVCHQDDYPYFFYMPNKFKPEGWPEFWDEWLSDLLIEVWITFAKNQSPYFNLHLWKTFDDKTYLELANDGVHTKKFEPYEDIYNFWKDII